MINRGQRRTAAERIAGNESEDIGRDDGPVEYYKMHLHNTLYIAIILVYGNVVKPAEDNIM